MRTKFIILIFFLSTFELLSAQVKVGVEAGINFSHYLGVEEYTAKELGGMKAGFQAGVTIDYETSKHWMFMSGLYFLQNRGKMAIADHMIFKFPEADIKINNMVLPLKVGYNIHINKNLSFIPSIGPYFSYAFSAGSCDLVRATDDGINLETVKWKPMNGFYDEPSDIQTFSIPKHKHFDFGGIAGIKAVIYKDYTVSFNYSVGINQVFVNKLRNSNFQFSVGYQF